MSFTRNKLLINKKADALSSENMLRHVLGIKFVKFFGNSSWTISKPEILKIKANRIRKCLSKSSKHTCYDAIKLSRIFKIHCKNSLKIERSV